MTAAGLTVRPARRDDWPRMVELDNLTEEAMGTLAAVAGIG